jgi:beta-phosphoglucomutase-like phosphatase (HAD superfamily)
MGVREAVTSLLFDFDGTIADTSAIWVQATRACFAARGFDLDDRMLGGVMANPWQSVIPTLSQSDALAIERDLVWSVREGCLACPPAEGLDALLAGFPRVPKAIVTSSYRELLVAPYLRRHGLEGYFSVVVGSEDTARLKPDPEPVLLALRLLKAGRAGAWMIGDSSADAEAARSAGIRSVLVGGRAAGGDLAAESVQALTRLLVTMMAEHENGPQRR